MVLSNFNSSLQTNKKSDLDSPILLILKTKILDD